MKLFKGLFIVGIVILFCSFGYGQNQIDYVGSYLWSGYQKPISDGDTLYINCLNGHGVERYYIGDLSNPVFIDKEARLGFEIIDFPRRLMIKSNGNNIQIASFTDFSSTHITSTIVLATSVKWNGLRLIGDRLMILTVDDSISTYDISNPANPLLTFRGSLPYDSITLGTTIALCYSWENQRFPFIYDISNPDSITFVRQDTLPNILIYGTPLAARGDTIAIDWRSAMMTYYMQLMQFTLSGNDIIVWNGEWSMGDAIFNTGNSVFTWGKYYMGQMMAYSYNTLQPLGQFAQSDPIFRFETAGDSVLFYTEPNLLRIYEASADTNAIMPTLCTRQLEQYGTNSVYKYENPVTHSKFLLVGMESNDGKLGFYRIMQSGDLSYSGNLPNMKAKNIIFEGTTAICQCPSKLAAIDLTNIGNTPGPTITHEFSITGEILDMVKGDSLYYIITSSQYFVIRYDSSTGFSLVASLDFGSGNLTSLTHRGEYSYILKGSIGIIDIIRAESENNPILVSEFRLPAASYKNIHYIPNDQTFWVSGNFGTEILSLPSPRILAHIDSSQIKSANQLFVSNDTVFVADDIAGLKIFTYTGYPNISLTPIGQYLTRNAVNHIAYYGNELYVTDYYSIQHLRWGAHVDITESNNTALPQAVGLFPNYPNPFNSSTVIRYNLSKAAEVTLDIYDILGRKVQRLVEGLQPAGYNQATWDAGRNSSGIYFYKIQTGDLVETKKMILIK